MIRPLTQRPWQIAAAIDGRLSCVVVPMKPQPEAVGGKMPCAIYENDFWRPTGLNSGIVSCKPFPPQGYLDAFPLPFAVGDRLWARETWALNEGSTRGILYRADPISNMKEYVGNLLLRGTDRWRSPVTMPRRFSRLTYTVDSVRVARYGDVTSEEAVSAGIVWCDQLEGFTTHPTLSGGQNFHGERPERSLELALIDGPDLNPWCAIGRVTVHNCNVSALAAEKETDR